MRYVYFVMAASFILLQWPAGYSEAHSQVPVSVTVSNNSPVAGEMLTLTFLAGEEIDFYAAFAEVHFEGSSFEFVSVGCGVLCEGGLATGGLLEEGRAGVSVSRTSPPDAPASGSFMTVMFTVSERAAAGTATFSFSGLTFINPEGDEFPAADIAAVEVEIAASVSVLLLQMPEMTTVQEGEQVIVVVSLFAGGLGYEAVDECSIGVSSVCSDPAGWDDEVWVAAGFNGADDEGNLEFSADIAFMRPPGNWYVAVRASVEGGGYVYGGTSGIWDGSFGSCGEMVILPGPSYRYTLAGWDFDSESLQPSSSVPANSDAMFGIEGANITGFGTGYRGLALRSTNWDGGGDGSKYWHTEISTIGFSMLELSSRQSGSGTGPRHFSVRYSIDGESWTDIEGGDVEVAGSWSTGVTDRLPIPEEAAGKESLLLRWAMVSGESIGGGITGPAGTNLMDDVLITGINPDPRLVEVYPGDANNDGTVNADDVLPLGAWWLCQGPPRAWGSAGFVPHTVEEWIPDGATYADTNGDGIVDHRDLVMVGLHFGKSKGPDVKGSAGPVPAIDINPAEMEGAVSILVLAEEEIKLRGVAFSIEVDGIDPGLFEIRNPFHGFSGEVDEEDILSFSAGEGDIFEAAFVIKGRGDDLDADVLAGFELIVDESRQEPFRVMLSRLTVSCSGHPAGKPHNGILSATGPLSSLPAEEYGPAGLFPNYPNPFGSYTVIPFRVDGNAGVSLDIFCMQGRLLHNVYSGYPGEGHHTAGFDGSMLAPGVYLCRLVVGGRTAGVMRIIRKGTVR